jgi:2-(1,2-epoxy-1,2-dihydrophenyl)acetyl-CoA isomerase
MANFETIRFDVADGQATITLARSDKRNGLNVLMFEELARAAELARDDASVRVVLLSAEGPSFCAGIDLQTLTELAGIRGAGFRSFVRLAQRPYLAIARMEKPTVAAVQGHAIGAGFQLALACDLRVAAPDVSFAMLEGRYGLIPDLGGSHHLTRLVGPARTKELVWTTRAVGADEALAVGLVNRLAPSVGELASEAARLVGEILPFAPLPQSLSKSLIDRAHETSLETELEREAQAQAVCLSSDAHREAVAASLERRPARFDS